MKNRKQYKTHKINYANKIRNAYPDLWRDSRFAKYTSYNKALEIMDNMIYDKDIIKVWPSTRIK